jgi:hypothetical protein
VAKRLPYGLGEFLSGGTADGCRTLHPRRVRGRLRKRTRPAHVEDAGDWHHGIKERFDWHHGIKERIVVSSIMVNTVLKG